MAVWLALLLVMFVGIVQAQAPDITSDTSVSS